MNTSQEKLNWLACASSRLSTHRVSPLSSLPFFPPSFPLSLFPSQFSSLTSSTLGLYSSCLTCFFPSYLFSSREKSGVSVSMRVCVSVCECVWEREKGVNTSCARPYWMLYTHYFIRSHHHFNLQKLRLRFRLLCPVIPSGQEVVDQNVRHRMV